MPGETADVKEAPARESVEIEKPKYGRVLVKLSGEALMGFQTFGVDPAMMDTLSRQIREVHELGVEIAIVVGGGNIIRGVNVSDAGFDRATGDYMGMLATVINALALQGALEKNGIYTRVLSAINVAEVAEPFIRRRAIRHLEKKRVCIFAAGTGNPYFSTDTAAALRAMEIKAEVILKGTKVDGVYDSDPVKNAAAKFFDQLDLPGSPRTGTQGDGRNGHRPLQRQPASHHRLQSEEGRKHQTGGLRQKSRFHYYLIISVFIPIIHV